MHQLKERKIRKERKRENSEARKQGWGEENIGSRLSFTCLTNEESQLSFALQDHEQIAEAERIWKVFYLC